MSALFDQVCLFACLLSTEQVLTAGLLQELGPACYLQLPSHLCLQRQPE